jgi:hypothetical protein
MKEVGLKYFQTRNLKQDSPENTFGATHWYCCSNNNPTVGQFVDALKSSIINRLASSALHGTNCEDDGTSLLNNLHFLLRAPDASPNLSESHIKVNPDDVRNSFHVAQQVQEKVRISRSCWCHGSVLCSICQRFHCHTAAS